MFIGLFTGINKQDDRRNTALHKAARRENAEIVQLLLDNGADWSLRDAYRDFPFYTTKNETIRKLISNRMEIDLKTIMQENNVDAMKKIIKQMPFLAEIIDSFALAEWSKKYCLDAEGNVLSTAIIFKQIYTKWREERAWKAMMDHDKD